MIAILERSRLLAWLLVVALTVPAAVVAQPSGAPPPGGSPAPFTPEQLEQVAAPIALYPDPLVAQVLMASTYPLEIVQAARFVKDNPKLTGDKLNETLKDQTWDDSVKSLVSFPQVLSLMDQKLDWVQKLGDAFLAQQKDLLDAIQRLRARAHAEGNLKTTAEQIVTVEPVTAAVVAPGAPAPPAAPAAPGQPAPAPPAPSQLPAPAPPPVVVQQPAPPTVITIEPANPQVIYVPAYNPTVVYGAWPYPAYPPYYPYPPGYAWGAAALSFGLGMAAGAAIWGHTNWGGGHVDVNVNNYNSYSNNVNRGNIANERVSHYQQGDRGQAGDRGQRGDRGQGGNRAEWKHNPENRRGVQYRDQGTQQRFNRGPSAGQQPAQSREAFRGRAEQGRQDLGRGGAGGFGGGPQAGARPGTQPGGGGFGGAQAGARPSTQPGGGSGFGGGGGFQGGQRATVQPRSGGGSAFQGMGGGSDARSFSNRGQSSRGSSSMGARGGGGGGGGGARGGGGGGRGGGGGGGGGGGRGGGRR